MKYSNYDVQKVEEFVFYTVGSCYFKKGNSAHIHFAAITMKFKILPKTESIINKP